MDAIDALYVPYGHHGYGAVEIKDVGRRAMTTAMFVSSLLLVSAAVSLKAFGEEERFVTFKPKSRGPITIELPPSQHGKPKLPAVGMGSRAVADVGIPVPVPDAEVSPDETIRAQDEFTEPATDRGAGDGTWTSAGRGESEVGEAPPDQFVAREVEPSIAVRVVPEYPPLALRTGLTGVVWVTMWVDKEGRVRQAVVSRSDNPLFDASALEAAKKWVFTPALMNKRPVSVWITVPFRFSINDR